MSQPLFSICIPNFNYGGYLGETLDSVLAQDFADLEILVSDNASTDNSVAVVQQYAQRDARIQLRINRCNVGFVGNLSKSAAMATGRWMTMLSSDDLMRPQALSVYSRLIEALGSRAEATVLSSTVHVIDGKSQCYDMMGIDWKQWAGAVRDEPLSIAAGADVWLLPAAALLRNSLSLLRTPFHFATTTYSKALHDAVESYSQGGIINPDKRFAWALLGEAEQALIVDAPLFSYRVHSNNQGAQQARSGALKHITDQYVASFSLSDGLLQKAGLSRESLPAIFVEQDVALRGLLALAEGNREMAGRILTFGQAAYPAAVGRNLKAWALRILLAGGPLGVLVARKLKKRALQTWSRKLGSRTSPLTKTLTAG
ncbi:MAG: glycosyltransferase family 2 protein [Pseudomonadota bacterium]